MGLDARRGNAAAGWSIALLLLLPRSAAASVPLVDAVRAGTTSVVRALLQKGVDVNATEPDGATALHWAVIRDDVATVELLLRAGAKVAVENDYGVSPLWLACTNGNAEIADRLLRAGADPNTARRTGEPVLMVAARTGNVAVVRRLLVGGAEGRRHRAGARADGAHVGRGRGSCGRRAPSHRERRVRDRTFHRGIHAAPALGA